jgi:CheY-like chemotaxis protein
MRRMSAKHLNGDRLPDPGAGPERGPVPAVVTGVYMVCGGCDTIVAGTAPWQCPVCGSPGSIFRRLEEAGDHEARFLQKPMTADSAASADMSEPVRTEPRPYPAAQNGIEPACEEQCFHSGRQVLLVDDDEDFAQVIEAMLGTCGIEMLYAGDGRTGARMARELKPDLILLDVRMPAVNGFQVQEQLSRSIDTMLIPVIIITGHDDPGSRMKSKKHGSVVYLTKPVSRDDLVKAINTCLRASSKQTE